MIFLTFLNVLYTFSKYNILNENVLDFSRSIKTKTLKMKLAFVVRVFKKHLFMNKLVKIFI